MKLHAKGHWYNLVSALLVIPMGFSAAYAAEPKHLDVDSMLRIASIGDSSTLGWMGGGGQKQLAHISPDGTKAVVVLQSGDPANNAIIGKLLLFEVSELQDERQTPQPKVLAEFKSRTNYQPIASVRWLDKHTVLFAATNGDAPMQLYRLDLNNGKLAQITTETEAIRAFALSKDTGNMLVVTDAAPPTAPENDPECLAHGCRVVASRLMDAISGADESGSYPGSLAYYDATGQRRRLVSLYGIDGIKQCVPNSFIPGGLSPNGRYALFFCTRSNWPSWWSDYTVDPRFSDMIGKGNTGYAHQYLLLDAIANKVRPLTSAPYLRFASPFDPIWIEGGDRLLLVGAVEPLEGVSEAERKIRAARIGVVTVDPQTGKTNFEFALDNQAYRRIAAARWDEQARILTLDAVSYENNAVVPLSWRQERSGWKRVDMPVARAGSPVRFSLVESQNDRPKLYVAGAEGNKGREILDPNRWLDDYKLGHVEEMDWQSAGGHKWRGSIYYPPNYVKNQKYPLVILTHGVTRGKFAPHGVARNYAAQPLAARGMVVLQMDEEAINDVLISPNELPRSQQGIESAIDEMDRRGLIDRDRVGLVGWSRTSVYANYMATHSEYPLKAMMVTDGGDIGWWMYLKEGVLDEFEANLGAAPFGAGLEPMLETSAAFNLHRWQVPMLTWSAGDVVGMWDMHAGLRRLDLPVEHWHFPDGEHDLFKMSHLVAGNQLMVDWFDFWLNDRASSDLSPTDQYQRWDELRRKATRALAKPRPPLLDWQATDKSASHE